MNTSSSPQDRDSNLAHPALLSINLLRGCNLQCRFCSENSGPDFLRDDGVLSGQVGRESLSTAQVRILLDEATSNQIRWVVFVGGEPTLRDDLPEILIYARSVGISTGVITNGYRLGGDPDLAPTLARSGLHVATFSWYGATDEASAVVTGHRDYRRRSLAGARAARLAGLRVAFNVVLTSQNVSSFADGSAWPEFEEFDPAYVFISPLMPAGRAGDPRDGSLSDDCLDLAVQPKTYLAAFAAVQRRWRSGAAFPIRMPQAFVPLTPDAVQYVQTLGEGPFLLDRSRISCRDICGTKPEVRWDGQLNACCYYPYADSLTIGNVFKDGLTSLLASAASKVEIASDAYTCPNYPDQIAGFGLGCPYRSALGEI